MLNKTDIKKALVKSNYLLKHKMELLESKDLSFFKASSFYFVRLDFKFNFKKYIYFKMFFDSNGDINEVVYMGAKRTG